MSDPLIIQARSILDQLDAKLTVLSASSLALSELQTFPWEDLWIVGRSHHWPEGSPHGSAATTGVHPATTAYHPIPIQGDRDNLYRVLRLGPRIPVGMLPTLTKVVYSFTLSISDPTAPQAFEFECQRQVGTAVANMAWQMKPGAGGQWLLSVFDYIHSAWRLTPATVSPSLFTAGKSVAISAEFTLTPTAVRHDAISFNGTRSVIGIEQPVAEVANAAIYFNIAMQADANATAAAWSYSIDSVEVHLS